MHCIIFKDRRPKCIIFRAIFGMPSMFAALFISVPFFSISLLTKNSDSIGLLHVCVVTTIIHPQGKKYGMY